MNHITKIQVNIAPSGMSILAVILSKRVRKSTPKSDRNVTALNTMDTTVVTSAPPLRESLNSSAVYAVRTSWNDIVEVSDAKADYEEKKREKARARSEEKKRERAEIKIKELEAELDKLESELFGEAATDYVRAAEIEQRKAEIEEELLTLYELVM